MIKKRWLILAILLAGTMMVCPAQAKKRTQFPVLLRFTQSVRTSTLKNGAKIRRTYPKTANKTVNRQMKKLIDRMADGAAPQLKNGDMEMDVGAYVSRTGERWMSFLTVERITWERKQVHVGLDARAYDMKTGRQMHLADLMDENSKGWKVLSKAVRRQLNDYFAGTEAPENKLNALCEKQAIQQTPFTLSAGKLTLHYRADQLYQGKNTLMHVDVYYHQLQPYFNALGKKVTDNSRYRMIALTYDDGPFGRTSMQVMDQLRLHGANATFFLVGANLRNNDDVVCREHDAAFTVASHNYRHVYSDLTEENVKRWRTQWDRRVNDLIGQRARIMRAPGGHSRAFARANCGLPLIHWSRQVNDAPNAPYSAADLTRLALGCMQDGGVILMHDANPHSPVYSQKFLEKLERNGYLCVTVEELFSINGIPLKPNREYRKCDVPT